MAGAGGHGSAHNITHGGLSLHATRGWHSRVGQGMCAVMWFWVLYRAKQDGAVLMGWRHPWEGHGHSGHDDHGNGHEEDGECRPIKRIPKDEEMPTCRSLNHFRDILRVANRLTVSKQYYIEPQ